MGLRIICLLISTGGDFSWSVSNARNVYECRIWISELKDAEHHTWPGESLWIVDLGGTVSTVHFRR